MAIYIGAVIVTRDCWNDCIYYAAAFFCCQILLAVATPILKVAVYCHHWPNQSRWSWWYVDGLCCSCHATAQITCCNFCLSLALCPTFCPLPHLI